LVTGSGPAGRISLEDVKAFAKQLNTGRLSVGGGGQPSQKPLPDFTKYGEVERKPMSMIRTKTAENLSYAWSTIPHVTQFDKADITELEKLRKKFSAKFEQKGGKLTITAFLLKVLANALKTFPQFNTSIDLSRNEIIYKKYYNIGVAVETDRGLLVPVIKDVDKKNIMEIASELNQMAERARTKKTTIDEMQGGCFTITNLGGIGGTAFTPIVNAPEAAILGVSRAGYEPVYVDGHFVPRLLLPLSLSYDHRLVDGADGARFIRWVSEAIQQPFLMDMEG
jgi:pyruvate dehydrogenase E2 component (dihydrolipoamide acetyltransferase)